MNKALVMDKHAMDKQEQVQKTRKTCETQEVDATLMRALEARFLAALRTLCAPADASTTDSAANTAVPSDPSCAATPEGPFLLMVSGGSDSTALARLAARILPAARLGILHVNHQLRGADADADEAFVRALADELGISFYCAHCDVAALADAQGGNVEAVGRKERYAAAREALDDLCARAVMTDNNGDAAIDEAWDTPIDRFAHGDARNTQGARYLPQGYILTAHTCDDRIENFYMRSIVGTGPGGFRGMDRANGAVLHPLLDFSRKELRDYLHLCARESAALDDTFALSASDHNVSDCAPDPCVSHVLNDVPSARELWREDATNAVADRFRTFVRHRIVPLALEQNPQLGQTLSRSMDLIADENAFLDELASDLVRKHVEWLNPLCADWFAQRMGGILPDTQLSVVCEDEEPRPDYAAGCVLSPRFANEPRVLQRRVVHAVLSSMLGDDARIETASVEAVLSALGKSGAVRNIQGDLAVSTNKRGTRIEPMEAYRARRRRL